MTRDEAIYRLTWVKDLSEMIGMVPIGAETRKAIDVAISALRELDKSKALRQPQPDAEIDDNFEPWLPNSRNQRCILPLMNLMLKDDGVEGSK